MRKTIIMLALASSVLAGPGFARDGSVYVGAEGGALLDSGPDLEVGATGGSFHLKTNTGWDADALIGYDFGSFRLEAEGAYKESNIQQVIGNGGVDVDSVSPGVQSMASVDEGGIQIKSLMANALYDLGGEDSVGLFAGLGLGYAWTELDAKTIGVVTPLVDDEASGLAWQALAGVRIPVNRHLEIGAKYRFFNVENLDYESARNGALDTAMRSHSILATVLLNFGGAREPAPVFAPLPPPPPAPPPSLQTRTCPDGAVVGVSQPCPPPPPVVPRQGERG